MTHVIRRRRLPQTLRRMCCAHPPYGFIVFERQEMAQPDMQAS